VNLASPQTETASSWRAWFYLVRLSWQRQARARLMVWISVGLLVLTLFWVYAVAQMGRWGMGHWRWPRGGATFNDHLQTAEAASQLPLGGGAGVFSPAVLSAFHAALAGTGFSLFSNWLVFSTFATFLLPLFSLSFATEALGQEREGGNLIWLLSRPLSRPAIYLAKFVAALPWALGLNLGGFALLCLAAGDAGRPALRLYWPAVLWGTLAFCALFHLLGVAVKRPAVVAILYCFFLETVAGNLPGYLKRTSISFYVRCMMYDAAGDHGIHPERPSIFLPVSGAYAWAVLAGLAVVLLLAGMIVFSRKEYLEPA
jgi:ABC-type transport system involved in multi-copper enzyme maturation permease subunit